MDWFSAVYYDIKSNRESGLGRFDICMKPLSPMLPGILIELKASKEEREDLSSLAKDAIKQIENKHYDTELGDACVILKYGIAFRGKAVEIEVRRTEQKLEMAQSQKVKMR